MSYNDRQATYLRGQGFSGSLCDMKVAHLKSILDISQSDPYSYNDLAYLAYGNTKEYDDTIAEAGDGRFFSIHGGKHIELGQILTPTIANFFLEFTIRPAAGDVGSNTTILSQHAITAPRVLTSGTDQLRIIYITTSAGSVTLNGNVPIQLDTDMHVRFENNSVTGTSLSINGGTPTTSSGVADHTLFGIDMIGSRHDHGFTFQGQIWDVSLPDGAGNTLYGIGEPLGTTVFASPANPAKDGAWTALPDRIIR